MTDQTDLDRTRSWFIANGVQGHALKAAMDTATEVRQLRAEVDRLRSRLLAVQAFADRDQDGATCPHNVTGQLRRVLNAPTATATP